MLYIVSTPIGNLEDITYRAVRILWEVDFIICEDTRVSAKLLNHYEIKKECVSFHAQSPDHKIQQILERIQNGETAALISDAGTPGISDPWYRLIRSAIQEGMTLSPLPWASALLAGLVPSGMHIHHFLYLGFLPVKKWRKTLLDSLKEKEYTTIIYESPHRILKTLSDLSEAFGKEHNICVARELTKIHETFHRGSIWEILDHFKKQPPKGEMVIIC